MKALLRIALLLISVFFLTVDITFAQNKKVIAADEAFDNYQFSKAIKIYKKAFSRTKSRAEKNRISYKMGECYRLMNKSKRAEANYRRIIKSEYVKDNPIVLLHYADVLKIAEKYEDARLYYEKYGEYAPDDQRAINGIESCKLAEEWKKNPTKYQIEEIKKLNSKYDDFAPAYIDKFYNALIFTSSREGSKGESIDDWTGQSFSDLFISRKDKKGQWSEPIPADNEDMLNTEANEGSPSFNSKFTTMYFTRCGNDEGSANTCKIWEIKKNSRGWSSPKMLILSNDSTVTDGHPAISPDELTLVFSSDRKNGKGGKDLWFVTRKSVTDDFKFPTNLGDLVNTSGDEVFPFFRDDTTLYFSSNGLLGLGGLDIFKTTLRNGEWTNPLNLQSPINSNSDDFGIIFEPENDQGFFTSNRKSGRGDDIYYFVNPPLVFTLQGTVKDDKTLQFISSVTIKMIGTNGSSVDAKTDPKGFYSFSKSQLKPNCTYELSVNHEGYFNKKAKITTVDLVKDKDFIVDFSLEPIPQKPVALPDILYDLAKWDLKPQYKDSLQGLIKTLLENETIVIELASHTDARDSEEKNDILSQRRAESVVNYLIERGIDPDRLVAKGYGERTPLTLSSNKIKDGFEFKEGTTLSEEYIESLSNTAQKEAAHSLNRRTEFKVLSKDFVPKPKNAQVDKKVEVKLNPTDKIILLEADSNKNLILPIVINDVNCKATIDLNNKETCLIISIDEALKLLKSGNITKDDFDGDPSVILAESTIKNNAKFMINKIRIGSIVVNNIEAIVSNKIIKGIIVNNNILNRFGTFTIDNESKQLIFK